ncbi:MAG: hypothetical protein HUU20_03800 [Pirellulales bacterium]|nr:hypothetical protein [Pirellulales bacterium]
MPGSTSTGPRLNSLSPVCVLGRGYSLALRLRDGHILYDAGEFNRGDEIRTRLARGQVVSRVEHVETDSPISDGTHGGESRVQH